MITVILVLFLWVSSIYINHTQSKHKRGFKASNELIDRIFRSTVQTGLLTSVVACIDLFLYLAFVSTCLYISRTRHLIFNIMLCKLYSMTLMSSLNARQGWSFSNSTSETGGEPPHGGTPPLDRSSTVVAATTTRTTTSLDSDSISDFHVDQSRLLESSFISNMRWRWRRLGVVEI
ncbi:hypothetical protein K435DRAFT_752611 [Dendrothele bispora CBS 962.96]|uniref:DUF6534 domain-containing protein n=1 Tax=Dendrothele bispora (strain CBS 962.96) TaxID=1314807 RepID=A0A4V4HGF8_DENBC|nr:hypothetical protein K435DRAFT_752611 [Dendrothele bispora CBS 962.96]